MDAGSGTGEALYGSQAISGEILDLRTGLATGVPLFSQVGVNAGTPPIPGDTNAPRPHEEVVHRDSPNSGIGRVRNTVRLVRDMCVNAILLGPSYQTDHTGSVAQMLGGATDLSLRRPS